MIVFLGAAMKLPTLSPVPQGGKERRDAGPAANWVANPAAGWNIFRPP
jgi:hypothetical protein